MRRFNLIGITGALLIAAAWSGPSIAQNACGDIEFGSAINSRFPNAANACLDVVTRDGEQYAHFIARIVRVRGNEVEAEFKYPDGTYGRTVAFSPSTDARVRIQGRTYRYRDLSRGQELDVYLPPNLWAFAVADDPSENFADAAAVTTVALAEPSAQVASLPSTASRLPLLASIGLVLIGLGAGLTGVRSRLRRSI
jgi:hypothetical protein